MSFWNHGSTSAVHFESLITSSATNLFLALLALPNDGNQLSQQSANLIRKITPTTHGRFLSFDANFRGGLKDDPTGL